MVILDTSVLSEPTKPVPAREVARWMSGQLSPDMYTTTVSIAELLMGVELLPAGKRRDALHAACGGLITVMQGRILPFDEAAARLVPEIVVGRKRLGRPIMQFDAMIAAIARSHGATVATRDTAGFADCGIGVLNPWAP